MTSAVTEKGTLYVICTKETKGWFCHHIFKRNVVKRVLGLYKILTARGKPRSAKTTTAAVLVVSFPAIMCSIPLELSLKDIRLITAVPAMHANTVKLLRAHTARAPIR